MTAGWDDARAAARSVAQRLPSEQVPLPAAVGRTLADPVIARCDLPGFDTSAMDGWAVAGPGPWQIVAEILAGGAPGRTLNAGEAAAIATGAAVPRGADEVIRSEDGTVAADVLAARRVEPGHHIRPQGEECRIGEELAVAGSVVTPAVAGLLAAAGTDDVAVVREPRIHLLLLGDELLDHGIPAVGQVRDSLGPQLPGWLVRLGGSVSGITRVADTVPALVAALTQVTDADVIVTTGGTAAGPVDCLHPALAQVGASLVVDSVAVRPGHPMLLALWQATPVLGLPGNPQSAVVALVTLGAPLLRAMLGRPESGFPEVILDTGLSAPARENRLVLGTVADGRFTAASHLGSAMLRGLAAAQGFAVLPHGGAAAGTAVRWLPLP